MATQNLGNVMTRLGGLKNVSGRRVMPGAEFLQDLEDTDTDVSGTAQPLPNFANFKAPAQNFWYKMWGIRAFWPEERLDLYVK